MTTTKELMRLADLAEGALMNLCEAIEENAKHRHEATQGLLSAVADVLAERARQIEAEGWSPEHDDEQRIGELAAAAACYCHPEPCMDDTKGVPFSWPWQRRWWKPTTRRRDLVKAGALILAEIERLDRAAEAKKDSAAEK